MNLVLAALDKKQAKTSRAGVPKRDAVGREMPAPEINQVWQSLALQPTSLHPKLAIGPTDGPHEREADSVAEQMLAKPARPTVAAGPSRAQRHKGQANGRMGPVPASIDRVLAGSSKPLEPALRQDMEQRFGQDFSRVRVHADAAAEQSAKDVDAHAYTVGDDIVFDEGRFAPGTHEGRRLISHELTHVVQQSQQVLPLASRFDRQGSGVEGPESVSKTATTNVNSNPHPITALSGKRIARQPASKSSDKTPKPDQFDTSNAVSDNSAKTFDVDKTTIKMSAESGTVVVVHPDILHVGDILVKTQIHTHPDFEFVLKQPDPVIGRDEVKVSLKPTGKVGSTLIVFLCYWRPQGSQVLHYGFTKDVSISVSSSRTSQVDLVASHLKSLEEKRRKGSSVSKKEQVSAEYDSTTAARKLLREVAGTDVAEEITHLVTRVTGSIDRFETARRVGYLQAVEELNAKALDKSPDYQAFGISLAGNLLWALAGLVPYVGIAMNIPRLTSFFKSASTISRAEVVETAFDVVGAMMVQFASGLPAGASTSDAKSKLVTTMTNANTAVCEKLRREVYSLLVAAMGTRPPYADDVFSEYLAELEIGITNSLMGSYSEAATKENGSYQQQARTDLLRLYLVSSSAIKDGELGPTQAVGEHNLVKDTISLLGGVKKLGIGQWELVGNQMRAAAAQLGYQLKAISDEEIGRGGGLVVVEVTPVVHDAKQRKEIWTRLADEYVISISKDELSSISEKQLPEVVSIRLMPDQISSFNDKNKYLAVYSADRLEVLLAKDSPVKGPIQFNVRQTTFVERGSMKQAKKDTLMGRVSD